MLDQLNNNGAFFTETLAERDSELFASIASELRRQRDEIELIASENFPKNDPIVVDEEKSLIGVISSTEIRRRVCENQSLPFFGIAGLVTPGVIKYIT